MYWTKPLNDQCFDFTDEFKQFELSHFALQTSVNTTQEIQRETKAKLLRPFSSLSWFSKRRSPSRTLVKHSFTVSWVGATCAGSCLEQWPLIKSNPFFYSCNYCQHHMSMNTKILHSSKWPCADCLSYLFLLLYVVLFYHHCPLQLQFVALIRPKGQIEILQISHY